MNGWAAVPDASQVRHPWRATGRTTIAALVGIAVAIAPHVAAVDWTDRTLIGVAIASAALITRAMADPRVEATLRLALPWLAADPTIEQDVADSIDDALGWNAPDQDTH